MDIKTEIMSICELSDNHKCKVFDEFNHRYTIGFRTFENGVQWFYCADNSTGCTIWADIEKIMQRVKPVRILCK